MTPQKLIDRKQICEALGVSPKTLERKMVEWGIDKCRCRTKDKPILYFPSKLNAALISAQVIESAIF